MLSEGERPFPMQESQWLDIVHSEGYLVSIHPVLFAGRLDDVVPRQVRSHTFRCISPSQNVRSFGESGFLHKTPQRAITAQPEFASMWLNPFLKNRNNLEVPFGTWKYLRAKYILKSKGPKRPEATIILSTLLKVFRQSFCKREQAISSVIFSIVLCNSSVFLSGHITKMEEKESFPSLSHSFILTSCCPPLTYLPTNI